MTNRWILRNEVILSVYRRDRNGKIALKIIPENVGKRDARFMSAISRLIEVWMSSREARPHA